MKKYLVLLCLFVLSASAMAGMLPGGFKSTVELKYEDDRLDNDSSLGTGKLTIKRPAEIAGVSVTPYVWLENESNHGFFTGDRKETEVAIGIDFVAFKNQAAKITVSPIYEYEDNASGDDDALMTFKIKADF